ncbi:uncharacterized protein YdaU (DUF1376 family) [Methylobacterium sp. BE186]|uniref:YdaU family protein n=1 Tax=Methylobacterium sp. BE186 TaxID=2817715 RepID=UPI002857526C|nr:DUF1376 domain-containing protein [Methylobacterium sp. BE186]MDR7040513.1 uncharacterized protein YdaU (DUF1376 family) [Methylobacterium sp. BE186]
MSTFPSLPLFTDAYIADTTYLTNEEHGAYLRLLMFAWRSPECRLPDDDARLARMLGLTPKRWAALKPTVMAFWTLENGFWTQKRLAREHAFVSEKVEKKRAAGCKGGRPKSLENNDTGKASGSENGKQNKSEPKAPTPTPINTPVVPKGTEPDRFEEFWSAYPKRRGDNPRKSAAKAYSAAIRRGATHTAIMAGVTGYAAELREAGKLETEFVAQAATWLNQERYERFATKPEPPPRDDPQRPDAYLTGLSDEAWRKHVRLWKSTCGQWDLAHKTPEPSDPRTKVPAHILAELGVQASRPRPLVNLLTGAG